MYLSLWTSFLALFLLPPRIQGHGRLIDPPSRASAWRYGFDTPHNYNDHELYCGGFTRQWVKNGGKCGVCGDAWDTKVPRAHEFGGTYGRGVVVRKYTLGGTVNVRVELTANHFGHFVFSVCPDYRTTTQKCLDAHVLELVKPQEGVDHGGFRYFPKEGNRVYEMKYRLPKQRCDHCVLQWRYIAGNNWGNCPNGTGAVGCGPQEEFRACADIAISGRDTDQAMLPPVGVDETTSANDVETQTTMTPPESSYNPFTSLIVSLVSFLVVFLVLSLLYIHFYRVGERLKGWFEGDKRAAPLRGRPPLPPPRSKRPRNLEDGLGPKAESLA